MDKEIQEIINNSRKKDRSEELKKQIELLAIELEKKDRLIKAYEGKQKKVPPIIAPKKNGNDEGTVLTLLSDVHPDNRITLEATNGINENTPEVSAKRLEKYFVNLVKTTNKNRQDIVLDNLVMGLLGDLIHGFIHEEYVRTNSLTPPEATMFMIEQLKRGFLYLSQYGNFKQVSVICKVGNHSRITDKVYSNDEARLSYEWVIYNTLKKELPQFNWIIEDSYFTYYQVYDRVIRFHHGHMIKYAGGIGGVYMPLMRYRLKTNQQKKADLDCIGHFHSSDWLRNAKVLMNGSVCGFDAYAMRKGFEPEPPMQQFLIIDSKRGFTINTPIILEG